jgi:hypothetical protein
MQGADVYSYAPDEDDMVTDPKLREHLAHWGINMMQVGNNNYEGGFCYLGEKGLPS